MNDLAELLIVGFDGLDPELLRGLPTFDRLRSRTFLLRSVESTQTPQAWASLYSGKPPAEHGVIYQPRKPDSVATLRGMRAQTFFEVLGQAGFTIGCIGMPMTYPVQSLDGFMVAGFPLPAPRYRADLDYFFPPTIKHIVERLYCAYLWANQEHPPSKNEVTPEAIRTSIEAEGAKIQCVREILVQLGRSEVDVLAIGFQFVDIVAHCCKIYSLINAYAAADKYLSIILRTFPTKDLIVVSDHGRATVTWQGESLDGFTGPWHRPYGTLICVGERIEKSLRNVCPHIQPFRAYPEPGAEAVSSADITDVYEIVLGVFGVAGGSAVKIETKPYSQEEQESILSQLRMLGYL